MRRILPGLAFALLGAAHAAEPGEGRIEDQIRLAALDHGAGQLHTLLTGKRLGLQDEVRHGFDVEAGKAYVLAGACDEDCGALVLSAEDTAGNVIDASDKDTDAPILIFRPEKTGKVNVLVVMEDCGKDACDYGIGVFALK